MRGFFISLKRCCLRNGAQQSLREGRSAEKPAPRPSSETLGAMNLATVIELSAATLGLFSGVFFCVGVLHVKDSTLETIATSMWGKGDAIAKELALQRVDFIFGASLLFLSFLVQVVGKCLPSDVALSVVATSTLGGVAVGAGVSTALLSILWPQWRASRAQAARRLAAATEGKL